MPSEIRTYDEVIAVLQLMKKNLNDYLTEVGATAGEVTWVANTLANMLYVQDYCATLDADKKAAFDIKQSYFAGDKGSTVSDFPTIPAAVLPNPPLVGGVLFTLRDMGKRFKLGPGYTKEIGIALGIEAGEKANTPEAEVKPTIDVFGAQTGYHFSVVVAGREQADMWEVQIMRTGGTAWQSVKTATGKSADVHVTPTTAGQPEQLQVRVQLMKSNANYGQLSDAAYVTVNP